MKTKYDNNSAPSFFNSHHPMEVSTFTRRLLHWNHRCVDNNMKTVHYVRTSNSVGHRVTFLEISGCSDDDDDTASVSAASATLDRKHERLISGWSSWRHVTSFFWYDVIIVWRASTCLTSCNVVYDVMRQLCHEVCVKKENGEEPHSSLRKNIRRWNTAGFTTDSLSKRERPLAW